MDFDSPFRQAVQLHQSGRLSEAEAMYQRALQSQPNQPDALHLLGVLHYQTRRLDSAVELIQRAIKLNPVAESYHCNLGLALAASGRKDQAISAYRTALSLRPDSPVTLVNLAIVLHETGDLEGAKAACQKALALRKDNPDAHAQLGRILRDQGRLDQAIECYQRALSLRPNHAVTQYNLGNAFQAAGRTDEAIACYQKTIQLEPRNFAAHCNLGAVLSELGFFDQSIAACRNALSLQPDHVEALCNLGNALQLSDRMDQALECYRRAVALRRDYPDAHTNLGSALQQLGQMDQAITAFHRAIEVKHDSHAAHWNLGLALLTLGDYQNGWPEFEWGWPPAMRRAQARVTGPKWKGEDLAGKSILIHNNWGSGDVIQLARYLPLVAQRGGRISFSCQKELHRLLHGIAPIEKWFGLEDALPVCDVQCDMTSLPAIFQTTLETIPSTIPCLTPDPAWNERWQGRIPKDTRLKVGLVWMNKPNPAGRCPPPSDFAPLAEVQGVWFCSLQKPVVNVPGKFGRSLGVTEQPPVVPPGLQMTDWTSEIHDFADTAGLVDLLDLVICVDTSVAHLAGAMGKPTWLILKHVPDWRWLLERSDSPWYPSMKLFRQPRRGNWATPIRQIVDELQTFRRGAATLVAVQTP